MKTRGSRGRVSGRRLWGTEPPNLYERAPGWAEGDSEQSRAACSPVNNEWSCEVDVEGMVAKRPRVRMTTILSAEAGSRSRIHPSARRKGVGTYHKS